MKNKKQVELILKLRDETKSSLKEISDKMDNLKTKSNEASGSISNIGNLLKSSFSNKVIEGILNVTSAVINMSSDMTELENMTNQVFGSLSEDVDEYAKRASGVLGRSVYDMKKYTSEMGAVLKSFDGFDDNQILNMSKTLAELSVDMGSFLNVDDSQTFNALKEAITGETESLKALGIVINDTTMSEYARNAGIKESWQNLDESTQAELRYQAILEKTKFMQGDAARTIDSYSNQMKLLKANLMNLGTTLGDKITPVIASFTKSINKLLSSTNDYLNKKNTRDYLKDFVEQSRKANEIVLKYEKLSKEKLESGLSNEKEERRLELYQELKSLYPDILGNIGSEAEKYQEVKDALKDINDELSKKTKNQMLGDALSKIEQDYLELRNKIDTAQKEYDDKIAEIARNSSSDNTGFEKMIENIKFNKKGYLLEDYLNLLHEQELAGGTLLPKQIEKKRGIEHTLSKYGTNDIYSLIEVYKEQKKLEASMNGFIEQANLSVNKMTDDTVKKVGYLTDLMRGYENSNSILGFKDNALSKITQTFEVGRNTLNALTVPTSNGTNGNGTNGNIFKSYTPKQKTELQQLNEKYKNELKSLSLNVKKEKKTYDSILKNLSNLKTTNMNALKKLKAQNAITTLQYLEEESKVLEKMANEYKDIALKTGDKKASDKYNELQKELEEKLKEIEKEKLKISEQLVELNVITGIDLVDEKLKTLNSKLDEYKSGKKKFNKDEIDEITKKIKELKEKKNNLTQALNEELYKNGILTKIDLLNEELKYVTERIKEISSYSNKSKSDIDKQELKKLKNTYENLKTKISIENVVDNFVKSLEHIDITQFDEEEKKQYIGTITNKTNEEKKRLNGLYIKNKITQEEYIDEIIKLFQSVSNVYENLGALDEQNAVKLDIENAELGKFLIEDEKNKKIEEYKKNIEKLFSLEEDTDRINELKNEISKSKSEYEKYFLKLPEVIQKELSENGHNYDSESKEIKKFQLSEEGEKLVQNLKDTKNNIKSLNDELNKALTKEELIKQAKQIFSTVQQGMKTLTKLLDGDQQEIANAFIDALAEVSEFAFNLTEAIMTGNPEAIIQTVMKGLDIITGLFQGLDYSEQINKAHEMFEEKESEIKENIKALRELNDSIKEMNRNLITKASTDTSVENLRRNAKVQEELTKAYANTFNPKLITTGVEKERLNYNMSTVARVFAGIFSLGITEIAAASMRKNKEGEVEYNFRELFKLKGKTSKELQEEYDKYIKHLTLKDIDEINKLNIKNKVKDKRGVTKDITFETTDSNLEEIKKQYLEHIEKVKDMEKRTREFLENAILESFEGLSIVEAEEQKKEYLEQFKKIYEGREDYDELIKQAEENINNLIFKDKVINTVFNDARNSIIENLKQQNETIDSLATGLNSYFNKLLTNISKVQYDGLFRNLETEFNDVFLSISNKLKDIRLSDNAINLKDFATKELNFNDLFKKVKSLEEVNNDIKEVVKILREQALSSGLSIDIVDKMFPMNDIKEKITDISNMLEQAMSVAIDLNSFDQFSMSLGDSIHKAVRNNLIKSFAESKAFKSIYEKFLSTKEYEKELNESKTVKESFDILKKQLNKAEEMLKGNGLSFRETNATNGEYLNGITTKSNIAPTNIYSGNQAPTTFEFNLYNNGVMDNDTTRQFAKEVIKLMRENEKLEVRLNDNF